MTDEAASISFKMRAGFRKGQPVAPKPAPAPQQPTPAPVNPYNNIPSYPTPTPNPYVNPANPYVNPANPYVNPANPYVNPANPYVNPANPYVNPTPAPNPYVNPYVNPTPTPAPNPYINPVTPGPSSKRTPEGIRQPRNFRGQDVGIAVYMNKKANGVVITYQNTSTSYQLIEKVSFELKGCKFQGLNSSSLKVTLEPGETDELIVEAFSPNWSCYMSSCKYGVADVKWNWTW